MLTLLESIERAKAEEKRILEEFARTVMAVLGFSDATKDYLEEPMADFETDGRFQTSRKPSVPGHQIPWYTSGFQ